ncbi:hypothetical protein PybrP1_004759 [[Pythium] brassicae (nom. inval.)]|nr:hypothetical protein PybrP1_004759 [[Pythium] brassicae (nom. inval.)]
MRALDRDLRITGASKKGASWQYHIEVLDTRARLPSFMDPGSLASPAMTNAALAHDGAYSPRARRRSSVGDAALRELPPLVRYSVMRRYNDFRQLYVYLADTYGAELLESLPRFPDGGLLSYIRGDDPRLLKYRREQLQRFLRALDEHPHLKWCKGLTHFLRPDVHELTTVGGLFQAHADTADTPSCCGGDGGLAGFVARPPASSSGYVSLSMVKSPEIRFSHPVSDGRGDRKRRRGPFVFWGSSAEPDRHGAAATAAESRAEPAAVETEERGVSAEKRASLTEEEENDEDEEAGASASKRQRESAAEVVAEQQQKAATRLMRLLSLDAPATAQ